jgi:hypothetical protein
MKARIIRNIEEFKWNSSETCSLLIIDLIFLLTLQ